jgi:hypothetical protein
MRDWNTLDFIIAVYFTTLSIQSSFFAERQDEEEEEENIIWSSSALAYRGLSS